MSRKCGRKQKSMLFYLFCLVSVASVTARLTQTTPWVDCHIIPNIVDVLNEGRADIEANERYPNSTMRLCRLNFAVSTATVDPSLLRRLNDVGVVKLVSTVPPPSSVLESPPRGRVASTASVTSPASQYDSTDYRAYDAHIIAMRAAVASLTAATAESTDALSLRTGVMTQSAQGTDISYVDVGGINADSRVLVMAAQHAREWIAVEVGFRFIELVADLVFRCANGVSRDEGTPACTQSDRGAYDILRTTRITIIPCMNPDGVKYSQTSDRYWRKNRQRNGGGSYGVDMNRNAYTPYRSRAPSSDRDEDSETYQGTAAFSATEMAGLRAWLDSYEAEWGAYDSIISYHSYGKMILYPPGDTTAFNSTTEKYDTLAFHRKLTGFLAAQMSPAAGSAGAPISGSCSYAAEPAYQQYVAYGDTPDWVWRRPIDHGVVVQATRQIPTFTIELPPGPGCTYHDSAGFVLHPRYIVPTVNENARALFWLMEWIPSFKVKVAGRLAAAAAVASAGAVRDASAAAATGFEWGAHTANAALATNHNPSYRLFLKQTLPDYNYVRAPDPLPSPPSPPSPNDPPLQPHNNPPTSEGPSSRPPPSPKTKDESNTSAVVAIVLGSVVAAALLVVLLLVASICFIKATLSRSAGRGTRPFPEHTDDCTVPVVVDRGPRGRPFEGSSAAFEAFSPDSASYPVHVPYSHVSTDVGRVTPGSYE